MAAVRLRFRRHPQPEQPEQVNHTHIAVLEHDLLGIKPEPGSMAALAIALRRTGTCLKHQPVEVTSLEDPRRNAICSGCGTTMVENNGEWTVT
jgi:hypothetical protein